ncbi:MAG: hypothetical protein KAI17_02665, partial [Thiotrichaceae bacterium]|nr:hypothetical protein [Thiotrichaceae bacterium]
MLRRWSGFAYLKSKSSQSTILSLKLSIPSANSYIDDQFTFLNLSHEFEDVIDWNCPAYGKLWTYNLNYFDY